MVETQHYPETNVAFLCRFHTSHVLYLSTYLSHHWSKNTEPARFGLSDLRFPCYMEGANMFPYKGTIILIRT